MAQVSSLIDELLDLGTTLRDRNPASHDAAQTVAGSSDGTHKRKSKDTVDAYWNKISAYNERYDRIRSTGGELDIDAMQRTASSWIVYV